MDNNANQEQSIQGSGGLWNSVFGGDDDTNLRSRAFLNVLFALSEGEIAGFPAGQDIRKYIYVNETPVVASNGVENIRGVTAIWRSGTQFQSVIQGTSEGSGSTTIVNTKVTFSGGVVTRTINDSDIDKIRVTLSTPGISRTDDEGHVKWSKVDFKIYLSVNGGAFQLKVTDKFEGKTAGGYARDYTLDVTSTSPPYQVRVERTNADVSPSNTKEQNDLFWQTYTTVIDDKLRYPNTALLFVRIDSAYFQSQPDFSIKLDGLICQIPGNYNPTTRIYTGLWNGTFTTGFTNNPAWCLLKLLTDTRFGLGININLIDKWSLYAIAQYCDELVSNGSSGNEPRFVYNAYLSTKEDAYTAIQSLLGQIRATAYYAGGQIMFSQDRPGIEPQDIFTDANVVTKYSDDGQLEQPPFIYDYVSLKEKHAVCHVTWYDPNEYNQRKVAYADLYDIGFGADFARYGLEPKEVDLPGCTSQAEAKRHARWLLATERLENKTITFAAGEVGSVRLPGQLIRVSDRHEQGFRLGGRIVAVSGTSVTVDGELFLPGFSNDFVVMVNGTEITIPIASASGNVITLSSPFVTNPSPGDIWIIDDGGDFIPETYRLVSVSDANDGSYGLIGVLHSTTKYALADGVGTISLNLRDRSLPVAPTNLTIKPTYNGYFVGWKPSVSKNVLSYALEWEEELSGHWTPVGLSGGVTDVDLTLPIGNYRFRVAALNLYGRRSDWLYSTTQYALTGKVLTHYQDGSIKLSRQIEILPGYTYSLITYCESPSGTRPPGLPIPYQDTRTIVNSPEITDIIFTEPRYIGKKATLAPGSYPDLYSLGLDNAVSYVSVTGGNVTLYEGLNYTGTTRIFTPGIYRADFGQLSPIRNDSVSSAVVSAGATCFLSQHEPGRNPIPGSIWVLSSTPV